MVVRAARLVNGVSKRAGNLQALIWETRTLSPDAFKSQNAIAAYV